jgi:hypothetical protein
MFVNDVIDGGPGRGRESYAKQAKYEDIQRRRTIGR